MAKRVLMVASVPSMIGCFNMNNIYTLLELGYKVDVACDFKDTSVWPTDRVEQLKKELSKLKIKLIQLDFSRSSFRVDRHMVAYRKVVKLIEKRQYSFIHTHTPIASAIVRMAARKSDTKVIYTAHGFHFYKGAPLKNWIVFYPVELWLSRYTDILITINKEDHRRAKKKLKAKKTVYIPGIGVDVDKYAPRQEGREKIRSELGIGDSQIMLLSVGELNENKNHEAVIKAIRNLDLVYVIVGKGELKKRLESVSVECNVDVRLMGFRNDVKDFYDAADIYVLPSIREGLNVSLMEAMASGLPVCCGKIRGNTDLIDENGGALFNPEDVNSVYAAIDRVMKYDKRRMSNYNLKKIKSFGVESVKKAILKVYKEL